MREGGTVQRYNRKTRWFHAGTYVTVLVLLGTGWWLLSGREGRPSPLSRVTGLSDPALHTYSGWVLLGLLVLALTIGARAVRTFVRETVRFRRGDLRWFARWPSAVFTGRFAHHDGHFDPGQRIANLLLVGLLVTLVVSGAGLAAVSGGPAFVWLRRIHEWATWAVTPVLLGHIIIAAGVLPGYRGVSRSMHWGGRLRASVARRIWPGWTNR